MAASRDASTILLGSSAAGIDGWPLEQMPESR
jgi:hypothetical protein